MHRAARPFTTSGPWRELGIFALALLAYQASRAVVIGDARTALDNTAAIVDAERALGIFWEPAVQGWAAGHDGLLQVLNQFYLVAHLPVTAAFFVWLWRRRRPAYRVVRDGFLAANALALAVFVALPVAPPRLAGLDGLDDTLRTVSGVDLHGGVLSGFFNPYAAVPSMHAGYALLVGVGVAVLARHTWVRVLALAYPAAVVLTIVATANHFVLDAVAGGAVMGLGLAGAAVVHRRAARAPRAAQASRGASPGAACADCG